MIEQYELKTHEIIARKIKNPVDLKQTKWQYQIGQPLQKQGNQQLMLIKSSLNPIFVRKDTIDSFQWRIRNLPYSIQTYFIHVDPIKQEIIVKTTNKKYYKKFDIPDMKRVNIKLNKDSISFSHKNQTLIISYKKPDQILQKELKMRKQFDKMNAKKPKQGDVECNTQ